MDRQYQDSGKRYLIRTIIGNDRLYYYDMYIRDALDHGYIVTSYIDYIKHYKGKGLRVLILRHDIDSKCGAVNKMFDVERKYGVKATYYFRWSTLDMELIKKLDSCAFEVGLHYETLGRYCDENEISAVDADILKKCREILKYEVRSFNERTGIRLESAASHGHPKNIRLGISNNVLLEGEDYRSYGLISEAYDRNFYENDDPVHISDCNILNNYGFFYNTNPLKAIHEGRQVIVFLSHPEHWQFTAGKRLKMMVKLIMGRYKTSTSDVFVRIAWGSPGMPAGPMETGGKYVSNDSKQTVG